jgi:hypothetical protein
MERIWRKGAVIVAAGNSDGRAATGDRARSTMRVCAAAYFFSFHESKRE